MIYSLETHDERNNKYSVRIRFEHERDKFVGVDIFFFPHEKMSILEKQKENQKYVDTSRRIEYA